MRYSTAYNTPAFKHIFYKIAYLGAYTMVREKLLNSAIADLPVSEEFYRDANAMGFQTLADISRVPISILVEKEDFSYRWYGELLTLLRQNNCLNILRP